MFDLISFLWMMNGIIFNPSNIPMKIFYSALIILILAFLLIGIKVSFKGLKNEFKPISKKVWILLIIILLFALVLRILPASTYVNPQNADIKYVSSARQLYETSDRGVVSNSQYACPFIVSVFLNIFGANTAASAQFVNVSLSIMFGVLGCLLAFLLSFFLFKSEHGALFSALLLAVLPFHIKFSYLGFAWMPSVFFFTLSVLLFLFANKYNNLFFFISAFLCCVFSIYIRIDNFLFAIMVFAVIFLLFRLNKLKSVNKKTGLPVIALIAFIAFILFLPMAIHLFYMPTYAQSNGYSLSEPLFSISHAQFTLPELSKLYFNFSYHPLVLYIFVLISFFSLLTDKKYSFLLILFWLLCFFSIFMLFIIRNLFEYMPYSYIPFAILFGQGISILFDKLNKINAIKKRKLLYAAIKHILLLFIIILLLFLVHVNRNFFYNDTWLLSEADKNIDRDFRVLFQELADENTSIPATTDYYYKFLNPRVKIIYDEETAVKVGLNSSDKVICFEVDAQPYTYVSQYRCDAPYGLNAINITRIYDMTFIKQVGHVIAYRLTNKNISENISENISGPTISTQ